MTPYITEILADINSDPKKIDKYLSNQTLKAVLHYAYKPVAKFRLPDGVPPYKPANEPMGMTPTNFHASWKTWSTFCRTDIPAVRRESKFIQLLESIHPEEAKIMLAIKDQKLTKLYPKVTKKIAEKMGIVLDSPEKKE